MKALFYSIKWRLIAMCIGLVVVPTVFMGVQAYNIFQEQTFSNTEKNLKNIAKDWFNTTNVFVLEQDRILKREESLYKNQLTSITIDTINMLALATEQYGASTKQQPVLQKVSETKFGNSGNVMAFNSRGDIFVLDNTVVTNQKFAGSSNSTFFNTSIDKLSKLDNKETLVLTYDWKSAENQDARQKIGVFSYYKPLDLIIGANSYVSDYKSQDLEAKLKTELKDLMGAQKIGENGYIWAINSQGEYVVSKDQYRNGENILETKDDKGLPVIQEIIDTTKSLPAGESYIRYFPWQNIGEKQPSQTIAAATYVPQWDWIIGVSAYQSDFLKGLELIQQQVIFATVIMLILGSAVAYLFASWIAMPIKKLEGIATKVAGGDLGQEVGTALTSKQGEVGNLARAFDLMVTKLRGKISEVTIEKAKDDAILGSMGEGMVVTDANGNILLINDIAADLFDTDHQAVVNTPIANFKLYNDMGKPLPADQHPIDIVLKSAQRTDQTVKFIRRDDTKTSLEITATPVLQQGRIVSVVQIVRDVTKAKEVDRMKTEFISLASHQLRTPLSAIRWFSEMLVNGDAGELQTEQKEFAKNISDSTVRMIELVNSLLNISRIESGRIIIDPHPTDLKELISGIVNDLKAKTEERQQTLVISVHPDLPKINLDTRLIGQVYLNLLTNAVKYTQKNGEISVTVSKKGDDVISQVSDNGYGIPKAQQGRIFEKFFRAENVAKVETDGTGLGLYLIKAVVESSGGKIWFESEEGKGTSFWFTLPLSGMKAKEGEVSLDI